MCIKLPHEDFNSIPSSLPTKILYVWSNHHAKSQECMVILYTKLKKLYINFSLNIFEL